MSGTQPHFYTCGSNRGTLRAVWDTAQADMLVPPVRQNWQWLHPPGARKTSAPFGLWLMDNSGEGLGPVIRAQEKSSRKPCDFSHSARARV